MQNDLVEIVARATCQWDGTDPEEIMPDGKPRWCDRIDSVTFLLGHALQSAGYAVVPVEPTEAMIEATRNMTMPRADSAKAMVSAMIVGTWDAMLQAARGGA